MAIKETDYNDFAEDWLALNDLVRKMHNHTLKREWNKAEECAKKAKEISTRLEQFFKKVK